MDNSDLISAFKNIMDACSQALEETDDSRTIPAYKVMAIGAIVYGHLIQVDPERAAERGAAIAWGERLAADMDLGDGQQSDDLPSAEK